MTIPETGSANVPQTDAPQIISPRRNRIAAIICLLGFLTLGGFGISKTIDERRQLHYLYEIRDINQKGMEDIRRTAEGYESTIVGLTAQNIEESIQRSIDENQKSIDEHRVQEWIGGCCIAGSATLLIAGILLLRRKRKQALNTAGDPSFGKGPAESDAAPAAASEAITSKNASRGNGPLIAAGAALAFLILVAFLIVASKAPSSGSTADSSPAPASPASEPANTQDASGQNSSASHGDWRLSSDTNAVTGEVTTVASLHSATDENQYIIIRLIGKKLDCYVNTNEFLETVENLESHISTVQYKFDDGKIVRQGWTLSSNNEALFYPGNCTTFITQIRKAKTLAFEFRPSDKVPETITFDVEGFPEGFKTGT